MDTLEIQKEELVKLQTKIQRLKEWAASEELRAARSINTNVDYWQARLNAMHEVNVKIKEF